MRSTTAAARRILSVALLAAGLARPAAAQPASGHEFRVDTATSTYEILPQVAVDPVKGGFVVVWKENPDCIGERFDASGVARGRFLAVTGCTEGGTAAALPPGGFVTAGSLKGYGGGTVFGRRFDASGGALSAFEASAVTAGSVKTHVRASAGANGDFVVVWDATGVDGSGYGIFGRRFLFSGAPVGAEFRVNAVTTGDQRGAAVASSAAGGFVVVWHSDTVPGPLQVLGQRFDSAGTPVASTFPVGSGFFPDVASDSAGNFVVVWTTYNSFGNFSYNVEGARFSSTGAPLGGPFRINANTNGVAGVPRVTRRNSDFVVTWQEVGADGGSSYSVLARRFGADGSSLGSIFRVNSYTQGDQATPAISSKPDGGFVVTWTSNGQDGTPGHIQVFGQKFCLGGDADGNGAVNVSDVFYLVNALFAGGPAPIGCADVNANGALDVADVFYLISFLFAGGAPPI